MDRLSLVSGNVFNRITKHSNVSDAMFEWYICNIKLVEPPISEMRWPEKCQLFFATFILLQIYCSASLTGFFAKTCHKM